MRTRLAGFITSLSLFSALPALAEQAPPQAPGAAHAPAAKETSMAEKVWDDSITTVGFEADPPPLYAVKYDVATHVLRKSIGVNIGDGRYRPEWKERKLTDAQHTALLDALQGLTLPKLEKQPVLPPGGFATFLLESPTGTRRLSVHGADTYFKLTPEQHQQLRKRLVELIPDSEWKGAK